LARYLRVYDGLALFRLSEILIRFSEVKVQTFMVYSDVLPG